ncbi:LCP family protein [Rugosimonospora acidiphila]|uniref:LCP family protein n=2 Tax=Rugosimonospora acidiphila TaxID=556531 RepID=A0ABP9RT08_9ACTN
MTPAAEAGSTEADPSVGEATVNGQATEGQATEGQGSGGQPIETALVEKPVRRHRARKVILICALVLVVLVAGGVTAAGLYVHSVDKSVKRVNAFSGVPVQSRPVKVAADAENLLILGSDTRDPENTSGSRSDTIILAHLPKGGGSAQLISIPRDTWVHVPRSANGKHGNVDAKINAAYAWGGVPLTVETIEDFTGVRIDHVVLVDFAGFEEIINALGGVDIDVDQAFTSHHSLNPSGIRHFNQGMQHMDGAAALDYSRERYAFADGDFARIQHQQQMIKAVLDKAASGDLLTNPTRLNSFVKSTAKAVQVDQTLSLLSLAAQLRNLRSNNLSFFTSPSKGTGMEGDQSVVFADTTKAKTLFAAVRDDNVPAIVAAAK